MSRKKDNEICELTQLTKSRLICRMRKLSAIKCYKLTNRCYFCTDPILTDTSTEGETNVTRTKLTSARTPLEFGKVLDPTVTPTTINEVFPQPRVTTKRQKTLKIINEELAMSNNLTHPAPETNTNPNVIPLDFSEHEDLLQQLTLVAKAEFRTIQQQILFVLHKSKTPTTQPLSSIRNSNQEIR